MEEATNACNSSNLSVRLDTLDETCEPFSGLCPLVNTWRLFDEPPSICPWAWSSWEIGRAANGRTLIFLDLCETTQNILRECSLDLGPRILGWAISYKSTCFELSCERVFNEITTSRCLWNAPRFWKCHLFWVGFMKNKAAHRVYNKLTYEITFLGFETSVHILYELSRWHTFTSSLWTSMTFTNWIAKPCK